MMGTGSSRGQIPVLLATLVCAGWGTALSAQQPISFERTVWPILEKACVNCHRGAYEDENGRIRKPKGDLRLDGSGWIQTGGKHGAILVPGDPGKSPLYTRTILPAEHDDVMPAKGDLLTQTQRGAIKRWIAEGAKFGDWVGEGGPVAPPPGATAEMPVLATARTKLLERLGQGIRPASRQAIERLRTIGAQVSPVLPGNPLLRIEFLAQEDQVTDRILTALAQVSAQVAQLNLGKCRITDAGLASLRRMSRLTRLDLHETDVTGRGLRTLTALGELRYLNLHGTGIRDGDLSVLAKFDKLSALYLWNTSVTDAGVARLRKQLPDAKIHHRLLLPGTSREPESNRKKRKDP